MYLRAVMEWDKNAYILYGCYMSCETIMIVYFKFKKKKKQPSKDFER